MPRSWPSAWRKTRLREHGYVRVGRSPGGVELLSKTSDTPQNEKFVANFKAYCKKNNLPDGDKRVTDDPIEAAYFGVYIWKQAVEKAASTDVDKVRKAVYGSKFLVPGGEIMMDAANHHTYRPVLIGEILADGQFKVVSRSPGLVKPEP